MEDIKTCDYIHKKWVIPIMLKGFLLFNCLIVGGYQIYKHASEWLKPEGLSFDFMALETPDLIQLEKDIKAELNFRKGK